MAKHEEKYIPNKSSVYVISQISSAETKSHKFVWLLVTLLGFFGCGYQIFKFFTIYFHYPVIICLQEERNWSLDFPAVTVCNLNRMKARYAACKNSDILEEGCIPKLHTTYISTQSNRKHISERRSTISCNYLLNGNFDNERNEKINFLGKYMKMNNDNRQFVGQKAFELIKYCAFDMKPCTIEDFVYFQSLRYGNCYTFNKGNKNDKDVLKTSFKGYNTGLELILDMDVEEYMNISYTVGVRVLIHDPAEKPNPDDKGLNISPGFETSIALQQTVMHRLPAPYRDRCKDYENHINQSSEEDCIKDCIQEKSLKICGCIDPTLTSISGASHCDMKNATNICCLDYIQDDISDRRFICDCPSSCNTTFYEEQVSMALWPSRAALLVNESNKEFLKHMRKNRALLRVFYSTLDQNIYAQLPMFEESEIFSYLGGELALWLGLSMFAIFELIEAFIYYCNCFQAYIFRIRKSL